MSWAAAFCWALSFWQCLTAVCRTSTPSLAGKAPNPPCAGCDWLLIIAITLHNFPEGLAVGVGFGAGRLSEAIALMIAIGLQNMPEGLAVALPLVREK